MSAAPKDANEVCVGPQSKDAGKASSCAGCPNQADCASGKNSGPDPAVAEVADRMSHIKHKILVLSGKGGVGKSTFASQLAWYLGTASEETEVGILDIDICGPSVPRMMGVEEKDIHRSNMGWDPVYAEHDIGVMSVGFMLGSRDDAIIWRGPRKNGLIKQFLTDVCWGDMDFLVVDAPPGTSDEHISIAQYLKKSKVDGAVLITTPQEVALLDVRKEVNFCKKVKIPILGVVENMSGFVCPCCSTKSDIFPAMTGGARKLCKDMNVPFLGSIPIDPQMLKACEMGKPYTSPQFTKVVHALLQSTAALAETANKMNLLASRKHTSDESTSSDQTPAKVPKTTD